MEHSALVDPTIRLYRRLREAGHDVTEWEQPEEQLDGGDASTLEAVVMTVRSPQDLELLSKMRAQHEQISIVALIIRAHVESYRQQLRAGAAGARRTGRTATAPEARRPSQAASSCASSGPPRRTRDSASPCTYSMTRYGSPSSVTPPLPGVAPSTPPAPPVPPALPPPTWRPAVLAAVAAVDLAWIIHRKRRGEPGRAPGPRGRPDRGERGVGR